MTATSLHDGTSARLQARRAHRPRLTITTLGRLCAAALILAVIAILARLLGQVERSDLTAIIEDDYLHRIIRFTLLQAALSTVISVSLAIPVARALARQGSFRGRALLLRLFSLPLVMPALVAIFGVVDIYGQQGLIARLIASFAAATGRPLAWPSIYGMAGILIAHVFFNLPLATRLLLPAWAQVPAETWRLAAQLGMTSGQVFRLIELPLLRRAVPQIAATIFMLCFVSFAIILTFGGGPRASTLEVAIFQAIRFDADLARAGLLAVIELTLCLGIGVLCRGLATRMDLGAGLGRPAWRHDGATRLARSCDGAWIALAGLFVLAPEAALLIDGLEGLGHDLPWVALTQAALLGLGLSLTAGSLATLTGFALAAAARPMAAHHDWRQSAARRVLNRVVAASQHLAGLLPLALSPMVLGMGLYLLISDLTNSELFADNDFVGTVAPLIGIVLLNAAMAIPYTLTLLMPALERARGQHDRLCRELGIAGWRRFSLIDWPLLRPSIATALALATSLGLGDLVGISLFGNPDLKTLGILLYEQIGAYRLTEAATTALLLLLLVLGVYTLIERLIGGKAARHG